MLAVYCGIAGVLLALAAPMLIGRVYVNPDMGDFYLPLKQFYALSLQQGDSWTWCPSVFNGFYLHGEGEIAALHPFNLLVYRWLPLAAAFNLECWIHYPLMALGFYALMRRRGLPRDAAGLGAAAFAFCGFNTLHFLHLNAIKVIAHIPWLLVAQDVQARTPDGRKAAWAGVATALLTASLLLSGYPQYVLFATMTEAFYWLTVRPHSRGRFAWWVLWKTAGLLGGGVQLVPTWDALRLSVRAAPSAAFQCSWSLPPANLAQLVSPYFFARRFFQSTPTAGNVHEFGVYAGAGTLALAAWAWARRRDLPQPRVIALLLAWIIVSFILAFGSYGYLYRLQVMLPVVGSFRCPCRYLLLANFGLAWLAAVGYADLVQRRPDRRGWLALAAVWGAAALVAAAGLLGGRSVQAAGPVAVIGGLLIVSLFVFLVAMAARGRRLALLLLPILGCADAAIFGLSYHYQVIPPHTREQHRARIAPPPVELPPGTRVAGLNAMAILNGWRTADGYAGLMPRRQLDYSATPALRLSGAAAVAVDSRTGPVPEFRTWRLVADPLPRVRLVAQAQVSAHPGQDAARIDLRTTALVAEDLGLVPGDPGHARLLREQNGRLAIETDAAAPRLLVVADSFHPGWRATVDGQPARVLPVYGDFLGCVVPAGRHTVQLAFEPDSLRIGWRVTAAGGGLTVLLAAAGLARSRRERRPVLV